MRSGTENVPGIAAFGEAVKVGYASLNTRYRKMAELRSYLIERIEGELPELSITHPKANAPHIVNITLPKIKSETMLHYLSSLGISPISSGALIHFACSIISFLTYQSLYFTFHPVTDSNATATAPTPTPIHCHQRIFSLNTSNENTVTTASPPTPITG